MRALRHKPGFTLIETIVVVAIIALLMAIIVPALRGVREAGRRAVCLSNMRQIGAAAMSYAPETRADLIIPIHKMMVTEMPAADYWLHRTAMWFSFGGQSATQPFLAGSKTYMFDDGGNSIMAGRTRPLNPYLVGDADATGSAANVYRCPSDRGYPASVEIDDSPMENAGRSCFDTLGNSYRASLYGIFPDYGQPYDGAFAIGPWGHRSTTIPDAARTVLYGEPTFFNMIGLDNGQTQLDTVVAVGWHRRFMTDNLIYCDGSARPTKAAAIEVVTKTWLQSKQLGMDVGINWDLISRGPGWRFDLWPTPGARIWSADPGNQAWNPPYSAHQMRNHFWPFVHAQNNLAF